MSRDNSELGRTVTTRKKTTGVSTLDGMARCERNIFAFDPFCKGQGSEHSNIFHSVSLRKVENIFPLVVVVALSRVSTIWWTWYIPGERLVSQTAK